MIHFGQNRSDVRKYHTWICLQSWPLAGRVILLNVMGHFSDTLMAVCSTLSSVLPAADEHIEKFLLTVNQSNIYDINIDQYLIWLKYNTVEPN